MTTPENAPAADVAAWLHTMTCETGETVQRVTLTPENPFGRAGVDYDKEFMVASEPLSRASLPTHEPAGEVVESKGGQSSIMAIYEAAAVHTNRRDAVLTSPEAQARPADDAGELVAIIRDLAAVPRGGDVWNRSDRLNQLADRARATLTQGASDNG